ncbi:hypothetical protein Pla8534_68960 [Lignipirellula cremea]|uniref:Uncharacterized protein n=1 Tax=Lignipirellula cremea TaxID=2528010 RepID=A0A518E4F1_9BACT|nr:hypothetical protein Pla8534_68960 [Lignipirellula cremea]
MAATCLAWRQEMQATMPGRRTFPSALAAPFAADVRSAAAPASLPNRWDDSSLTIRRFSLTRQTARTGRRFAVRTTTIAGKVSTHARQARENGQFPCGINGRPAASSFSGKIVNAEMFTSATGAPSHQGSFLEGRNRMPGMQVVLSAVASWGLPPWRLVRCLLRLPRTLLTAHRMAQRKESRFANGPIRLFFIAD